MTGLYRPRVHGYNLMLHCIALNLPSLDLPVPRTSSVTKHHKKYSLYLFKDRKSSISINLKGQYSLIRVGVTKSQLCVYTYSITSFFTTTRRLNFLPSLILTKGPPSPVLNY